MSSTWVEIQSKNSTASNKLRRMGLKDLRIVYGPGNKTYAYVRNDHLGGGGAWLSRTMHDFSAQAKVIGDLPGAIATMPCGAEVLDIKVVNRSLTGKHKVACGSCRSAQGLSRRGPNKNSKREATARATARSTTTMETTPVTKAPGVFTRAAIDEEVSSAKGRNGPVIVHPAPEPSESAQEPDTATQGPVGSPTPTTQVDALLQAVAGAGLDSLDEAILLLENISHEALELATQVDEVIQGVKGMSGYAQELARLHAQRQRVRESLKGFLEVE